VAYLYYASVQSACELPWKIKLRFIGVFKTATRQFSMHFLSRVVLPAGKGNHKALKGYNQATKSHLVWLNDVCVFYDIQHYSPYSKIAIERSGWQECIATGQAIVFGEDLEPATASDEMRETVLALDNNQPQPPTLESSHTTQRPCLTAGVCWKKLL
jgi:hypothetical protein